MPLASTMSWNQKAEYTSQTIICLTYHWSTFNHCTWVSIKWNHIVHMLFCLVLTTQNNYFEIRTCCYMNQFSTLNAEYYSTMYITTVFFVNSTIVYSSVNGRMGCFQFWTITNKNLCTYMHRLFSGHLLLCLNLH